MFNRVSSQDVSASYASIGIVRVTFTAARQTAAPPASPTETVAANDSVSLSPQARAAAQQPVPASVATGPAPVAPPTDDSETGAAPVPPVPSPTASGVDGLAAALIKVLDTNSDGSLSKDEFVEGAKALLGRGRARRRGGDDGGDGAGSIDAAGKHDRGHHVGRGHRLERRLEKAFGRIDADDNGSLDAGELAAVLARASRRKPEPAAPTTEPAPSPLPAQGAGSSAPVAVPPITDPATPQTPEQQTAPPAPTAGAAQPPAPAGPASPSSTSLFSLSVTTVTFVSIAVQKYQAVNDLKA